MATRPLIDYSDLDALNRYSTLDAWSDWSRPSMYVSGSAIESFGILTHNQQLIHDESVEADETPYGKQIAHGLLLVAFIPALLDRIDEGFSIDGYSVRVIRGIDRLRLPSPVYPRSNIRARIRNLRAHKALSGKGTIIERDLEIWLRDKDAARPAVSCVLKMQYF